MVSGGRIFSTVSLRPTRSTMSPFWNERRPIARAILAGRIDRRGVDAPEHAEAPRLEALVQGQDLRVARTARSAFAFSAVDDSIRSSKNRSMAPGR
jgi:hypothetical protein